ncbi:hypothetical protein BDN70DRAFT_879423 [Pholiota conissans]|uniref:C2H2-type domain-containing protein n=1 Tax=Pholiota conissans TaxID=109636 RepID=A0A9P5YZX4_9AGAR|nr:hypothetical protein BDN70DRAFT_879423 [Pholiota conissans]
MHRATSHRKQSATRKPMVNSGLVGPGMGHPDYSSYAPASYDAYNSTRTAPAESNQEARECHGRKPRNGSQCCTQCRYESCYCCSAHTRESIAQPTERLQTQGYYSDGSAGYTNDHYRQPGRVWHGPEDTRYRTERVYQHRGDEETADDADSSVESDYSFEEDRPRAIISDIRNRVPYERNSRVREPQLPVTNACHAVDDTSVEPQPLLPPAARMVRASDIYRSTPTEGSVYEDEDVPPSPTPSPTESVAPTNASAPPRSRPVSPPLKRKLNDTDASSTTTLEPVKVQRVNKGNRRRQYKCPECPDFYANSKGDLKRHGESLAHKNPSHFCMFEGCEKKFTRHDALKRHMNKTHGDEKSGGRPTAFKSGHPKSAKSAAKAER